VTLLARPYQSQIIADSRTVVGSGKRRICIVSPTGSGKTVVAALVIEGAAAKGNRVLFLVHRRELIKQASAKLHEFGVDHGIIAAGFLARPGEPVQIASVQTLHARAIRGSRLELPPADILYIDEAHHVRAATYERIIESYPKAVIIGLTATPMRGDGRGLGNCFDELVLGPSVQELIGSGFLVPTLVWTPSTPDLTGVHTRLGDYHQTELAERVDTPKLVGDIIEHWHRLADRRPTTVFASSVQHSVHIRDEFRASGVTAEHIDGDTPPEERDAYLAGLADGSINVITNFGVLTEGWDCPSVSCIVLARPTKNAGLFRQMAGRGLRPSDGKTDCIILDHAGCTSRLGLLEDPVQWVLTEDQRMVLPAQKARLNGTAPPLCECPKCGAIRSAGQPCRACGWRPTPRAKDVAVIDGELALVDRNRRSVAEHRYTAMDMYRWHAGLVHIAKERGYNPGWAFHKYVKKFATKPPYRGEPTPEEPTPEIYRWVRHQDIAWAKAKKDAPPRALAQMEPRP
jgi:DNA repair protein RadD